MTGDMFQEPVAEPEVVRPLVAREPARMLADPLSRRVRDLALDPVLGEYGAARRVRLGIATIALAIVLFIGWAAVAILDEVTASAGTVMPAADLLMVQHLEGGLVREILVEEGQLVETGEPLVRFDGTAAMSELGQARSRRAKLALQAERLAAFTGNRPFNPGIVEGYDDFKSEQSRVLASRIEAREQQHSILHQQMQRDQAELTGLRNEIREANRRTALIGEEVAMRDLLFRRGNGSRVALLEAEKELGASHQSLAELGGRLASGEKRVEEDRKRFTELDSRLDSEAVTERSEVMAQIAEIDQNIRHLQDRVNRLEVLAPARGIIQSLPIKAVGAIVQPGGLIAELVPVEGGLVVEARISTRDIGFVAVGQAVRIKVSTFNYVRYGTLFGRVEGISATTFQGTDGVPYYKARIVMDRTYLGDDRNRNRVLPGMTVTADILSGSKTVLEYLLKPIRTAFSTAFHER